VRAPFLALGFCVLACASGAPEPKATSGAAKHSTSAEIAFPPTGPVELRAANAPAEGTLYQLVVTYEGRTEIAEEGPGAQDPQTLDEKTLLEIDYRQMPVATPTGDELASTLLLEALKRRMRLAPPGKEHILEIGDDRLRTQTDDKVDTDLRGAQPKQDLTPRVLIGKPFALVVDDAFGNPQGITIRGLPAAKKMLATLPLRESLGYLQIAFPNRPVSPGDTWHAKRFFPNPIGKLGLAVDVEMRLVGFERVEGAPCAHVTLRSRLDGTNVPSEVGFAFEEVHYQLSGDAWLDLSTGQVESVRIEDVAATLYRKTAAAIPARARMRYEGRAELKRLDEMPAGTTWADGSKRFSAVK
jgi:hypothetical protein